MLTLMMALTFATPAHAEVNPNTECCLRYEIKGNLNDHLGWLVVVGSNNCYTNGGTWLWEADTNYWFWDGTPFPASFRLYPPDANAPTWDPATNDLQTTHGPFDTSGTVSPHSTGAWHKVTRYVGGSTAVDLGYLCRDSGDQYWYETAQNSY